MRKHYSIKTTDGNRFDFNADMDLDHLLLLGKNTFFLKIKGIDPDESETIRYFNLRNVVAIKEQVIEED